MRIAIQGEPGSNSHLAALQTDKDAKIIACAVSPEVFEALEGGKADIAVLPIENSLHGSVADHYDLMLAFGIRIIGETELRIRHNVVAAPGVTLADVRRVLSHPVALSQCRRWLRAHPQIEAVPFYDTAGAVKHVLEADSRDAAGIAAGLAAEVYGGVVLESGIEDHAQNYTRFLTLTLAARHSVQERHPDKMSVVFGLEHRPGSLIAALEVVRAAGLNLTKIESRPVPGRHVGVPLLCGRADERWVAGGGRAAGPGDVLHDGAARWADTGRPQRSAKARGEGVGL